MTMASLTMAGAAHSAPAPPAQHGRPVVHEQKGLHADPLEHPAPELPDGATRTAARESKAVGELVAARTENSSTWRNPDGSISVRQYLEPQYYRDGSEWQPISTALKGVPDKPGWWTSTANSWSASFGPADAAGGSERITIGSTTIGLAPLGIAHPSPPPPRVADSTATYSGLWPGVDLRYRVSATAVKEDIVLSGPTAPADYAFRLTGATARVNDTGGADVLADGQVVGTVPPVTVTTSTPGLAAGAGASLTVTGDVVRVSVSPSWLAGLPESAFPVVIDPTFGGRSSQTRMVSVGSNGGVLTGQLQMGRDSNGQVWRDAFYVPAPVLPPPVAGAGPWQLSTEGMLSFCNGPCGLTGLKVYGLPTAPNGTPGYADITAGQLINHYDHPDGIGLVSGGTTVEATEALHRYMTSRTDGWWFGVLADTVVMAGDPLATFDPARTYATFGYIQQPPATTITAPANGSVLATTTPTLSAAPVTGEGPSGDPWAPIYNFRVSTSPDGSGTVIDSGWLSQPTWTVPPGSLHDGVTYWATVRDAVSQQWYTSDSSYVPPVAPRTPVSFQIKQRLGSGGPSPVDTVGSPPQGTTVPGQGAPDIGLSAGSETVNMVTGNLSLVQSLHSLATASGNAGPALEYNSSTASLSKGGNYGLTGQYFPDPGGSHVFGATPIGQRTDSGVNATWSAAAPPVGGLYVWQPFLVRWTGALTLPAGHWLLGGLTGGGLRVSLNGGTTPVYDNWSGAAAGTGATFGSTPVAGGQQYTVEVDYWENFARGGQVQLWVKNSDITDPGAQSAFTVPSNWLTPAATGLPPGWSLTAAPGSVAWTRADDQGSQVVLTATGGDTATFTRTTGGAYRSPPGSNDLLAVNGDGRLQLSSGDRIHTFNPDGTLASMTTATDDRRPASLQYAYTGTPAVLTAITDPVSARTIRLFYGGDPTCTNSGIVAGMLCRISYWDGTVALFSYNSNGQLALVAAPGYVLTQFGYDGDNRLNAVRDPLTSEFTNYASPDAEGPWEPANCAGAAGLGCQLDTVIGYDTQGRVASVTQPVVTPSQLGLAGALRPVRTYTYAAGSTQMSMAGFSPSSGYAKKYFYDGQGRITKRLDSGNHAESTAWDGADRPVATIDAGGKQTSLVYDSNGNVVDRYGPAPAACYAGAWPAGTGSPGVPFVGYLPVANPLLTAGCLTDVPHARMAYDEGVTGLAATYWSNGQLAGAAAQHGTGAGGTGTAAFCGTGGGVLCAQWAAGSAPVLVDSAGNWSLRLTGRITLGTAQTYDFKVKDSQPVKVVVDGAVVVQDDPVSHPGYTPGQVNSAVGSVALTAGSHIVSVEFTGNAAQLSEFGVFYGAHGSTTLPVVPDTVLSPNYGMLTSTTDPDGKVVRTQYTDGVVGPELGLPTASVNDPNGLALTTRTSYEAPGSGFLRRTATTLPSGATTTFAYYGGADGPVAAVCGVPAGTPQGGLLRTETEPAPGGSGKSRVRQFVYTAGGLQAGVRTGPADVIASQPWQCTLRDGRGRTTSQTWPGPGGTTARTVTYTYGTFLNPLVASVSDSAAPGGPITVVPDFLGRVISYTDGQGKTTRTTYDRTGRATSTAGPAGTLTMSYDANSSQLSGVALNGTTLATPGYDVVGRMTNVAYSNNTTATIGYDTLGHRNSLVYRTPTGTMVAGDKVTLSPAGRYTSELMDIDGSSLTNPNPAGPGATDYTYDGAGRLTRAYLPTGAVADYGYAANPAADGCQAPGAGADTNRTRVTVTPAAAAAQTTDYCYNGAAQLTGTVVNGTAGPGGYAYDPHGNQTKDGTTTLVWDASDRVTTTAPAGGAATDYRYDALDRVLTRQTGGTTTGYWYGGFGDSPGGTLDALGNVTSGIFPLPGGVSVTTTAGTGTWSYPDLRGNFVTTADSSGTRTGAPVLYDPWGQTIGGGQPLANTGGSGSLGAYGAAGKVTDTASGIVVMGARALNPAEARFLSVDPIRGGCANAYVYGFGDPLNGGDLTGQGGCVAGGTAVPAPGYHCSGGMCTYTFSPQQTAQVAAFVSDNSNSLASMASTLSGLICGKIRNAAAVAACAGALAIIIAASQDDLAKLASFEESSPGGELQIAWHGIGNVPNPFWPAGVRYLVIGTKCP
ncbi:RHS repeat-associated core domain-containing protein [Kitasatospora purpeofusca]|uniref:RHS repeat-associated core domain-containing protein n=1 Tax=Kitasatospora purpeofusca TaxID=67352 RepID=UPI003649D4B9